MIPTSHVLVLAAALFVLGLGGVILRRNLLIMLMAVELMLNAVNLTFVVFARAHGDLHGQVMALFIVAVAAAEAAVGLAIIVAVFRTRSSVDVQQATLLRR